MITLHHVDTYVFLLLKKCVDIALFECFDSFNTFVYTVCSNIVSLDYIKHLTEEKGDHSRSKDTKKEKY